MDVLARAILFAGVVILTAACTPKKDEVVHEKFTEPTSLSCEEAAIANQFVVAWNNGSTSVIAADSQRDFVENFVVRFEPYIRKTEYNYRVRPPLKESADEAETPTMVISDDWGQEMIEAPAAWEAGHLGQGVTVAVIDTGVKTDHEALANHIAINASEVPDNDIDDDDNGYVDDVSGWDFIEDNGAVIDGNGHGTHIAGVIAGDHSVGSVKGVAPSAKILPLRFLDDDGSGDMGAAILAIDYSVLRGAKIINASWGGPGCSDILRDKINELSSRNILFMAAAGNEGADLVATPEYPAAFTLDAQITVGASTPSDRMAGFSNFSRTLVALLAPGKTIYSAYTSPSYKNLDGTSMATPFVSAAAAVLWSAFPSAAASQIKAALLESVDTGNHSVQTEGRLNLRRALERLTALLNVEDAAQ